MLTKSYPSNLDQQLRTFVEGAAYWRKVVLMLPDSPQVYIMFDTTPEKEGYNRNYKGTPLSPGMVLEFVLAPHQTVAGQASEGFARLGVLETPCDAPGAA